MKKVILFLVCTIFITACGDTDAGKAAKQAARVKAAENRIAKLQEMTHTCDTQGGIVDIQDWGCYKGFCRETLITCGNKMERRFKND